MTDAGELTLKQILDSAWVRRIARACMIVLPVIVTSGGSFVAWVMFQNWQTSDNAVRAAQSATTVAGQALVVVKDVQQTQDARAALADQARLDQQAWQKQLDDRLIRLNQRVSTDVGELKDDIGEIKGAVGELKGLIIRQTSAKVDRQGRAIVPTFVFD